ncbi:S-adenosyl-L-methionine-dependent methyltransferase [Tricharina praecox]|uniref:S-adenosyl-L-methionine-dependent methyltransferase n=1 Tax=Tricharina praecox TaxID=43433 RepID=UPI00221F2D89|nr:S-adenosyl-L-methionine-dependent methyltransferase [Tricharina praecox]KAI5841727.1 S-adenosyl-L-methionine-dependent methyltransferase [Tricharina praecox]
MATAEFIEQPALEVDDADFSSSEYSSTLESSTHSITSSIVYYVYENGRRYHRFQEGKYMLPNDEREQDRLDLYHHLQLLSLKGSLYVAPIGEKPQHILDCGTGTGIWALDMGELFPSAEVVGVDLSPIQPDWVVPNVRFEVDDLELDWTFRKDYFDLIHSRNIAQSVRDWPKYLEQIFLFVLAETAVHSDDGTLACTSIETYFACFIKSLSGANLIHQFKQPWGGWPKNPDMKRAGYIAALTSATGLQSYAMAPLTRYLGMSSDEVVKLCNSAQTEIETKKVHSYQIMWHVVGRKPETKTEKE